MINLHFNTPLIEGDLITEDLTKNTVYIVIAVYQLGIKVQQIGTEEENTPFIWEGDYIKIPNVTSSAFITESKQ